MHTRVSLLALTLLLPLAAQAAECPALLKTQGELPKLRSKDVLDLCELYAGKPLVVVNTASHCGFTPQFKGLEALYQKYKDQGLEVLGVPSDDFKQEAADAAETAKVCYGNYGVTFNMTSVQPVSGNDAIPLFKDLAAQADQVPRWNFFKYVVDRQGKVVAEFSSLTKPDDPELQAAVEKAIASQP
ncbi:redoxin domain-containing protein [Pseudomonas sp. ZM23]|uniref:Glutathione peroxidase n=1 Tax=Pseudomonas triclosanedens TaxID=2961893 RepID=A0ABY7A2B2_9PSED|nr:redoxin domain-containing protein [Pseudomonas triclosanedens]MCP8464260.1 redoxin domain-containing protein [Pseudomonas triclosanedens]MCP8471394.1 redoxin domain-containing protein [Pseudomonas triclosanedens]MCP8477797.1 redoxin domain-containing protein [Pseudomonas triclosanedens]WAI51248.1 redoxin domain-containing protein [Pseudomonas triclosanedens]